LTKYGLKKAVEQSARELMFGSPLFPAIRTAYQRVFDRDKLAARNRLLRFYAQFLSPGDLVFDIGANVGDYADAFLTLGARVVAVEPNPACCERLKRVARRRDLIVENCAMGDAPGSARLHICADPGLSTLSNEWYETARNSEAHGHKPWPDTIEVEVATLDSLAAKYGIPKFVKIDVEGFEENVLAGLSFQPQALSFEFHFSLLNAAHACLNRPALKDAYRFNYTIGNNYSFELNPWVDMANLYQAIAHARQDAEFGEIFCRKA
jgi:FkbM family methyltransferase